MEAVNAMDAALAKRLTRHERERSRERLALAVAQASGDSTILPVSAEDASPSLPEDPDDGLTPQQRLAVAALLCGKNFVAAAREAGVSVRTLYTWRQQPAFERALNDLSRDALEMTAVRVRNLMLRATRVLAESMLGPSAFEGAIRVANSGRLWAALNAGAAALAEREAARQELVGTNAPASGKAGS